MNSTAAERPVGDKSPPWRLGGALVLLVVITYIPAWKAGFVMDDDINITANHTLLSPAGLIQIWLVPSSVQQYYPLVHTMFWVESRLWGFDPLGYHLINMALHALNAVLVWRLLARLNVPGAFLAAMLFAVHPVEVESVVWAVERKNVLSLALALGSILCYFRFAPPDDNDGAATGNDKFYVPALVLFAAALFAKTAVVTLPAVVLVILWWKRGRLTRKDAEPLLPFFLLAVGLGLVTVWQEKYQVGAQGVEFALTPLDRFLLAGRALWFYVGKLLWPFPVMFFYPRFVIDARQWWQYLFPAAALAVPVLLWSVRHRLGRGPLAGVLIYAGVLMPVLGFFNIFYFSFSYVADHFQYHASVALLALVAATYSLLFDRLAMSSYGTPSTSGNAAGTPFRGYLPTAAGVVAGLVIFNFGVSSFHTARLYRDEETLYTDAIAKNPQAWIAYSNLGVQLAVQQRYDEAIAAFEEGIQLEPANVRLAFNLGRTLMERGTREGFRAEDLDRAIALFQASLRDQPDWPVGNVALARALAKADRLDEALASIDRALAAAPQAVEVLCTAGEIQQQRQDFAEARKLFQRAVQLQPRSAEAQLGLGMALESAGETAAAANRFEETVRLNPDSLPGWLHLARIHSAQGEFDKARAGYRQVLRLDGNSSEASDFLQGNADRSGEPPAR